MKIITLKIKQKSRSNGFIPLDLLTMCCHLWIELSTKILVILEEFVSESCIALMLYSLDVTDIQVVWRALSASLAIKQLAINESGFYRSFRVCLILSNIAFTYGWSLILWTLSELDYTLHYRLFALFLYVTLSLIKIQFLRVYHFGAFVLSINSLK
jgi:hypothetical protein